MQKITPFLTFDGRAEEAVAFYTSVFPRSKVVHETRVGGRYFSAVFELEGQTFMALNGGPTFSFAPGISLFISCESQAEIDRLWEALAEGGGEQQCGWVKDRFGVSWQVIPSVLGSLMSGGGDPARAQRVTEAMLSMGKMDIAALQRAYEG